MREIKFRFRNKNNGKLEYFCLDELLWENGPRENIDWSNGQQFTGLHDRNGKEIWEGDVLKWNHQAYEISISTFHGLRTMWGNDKMCKAYATEGEVIGDIYENPELIKEAL